MRTWLLGGACLLVLATACQAKVGASAGASTGGDAHAEASGDVKSDGASKPEAKPDSPPPAATTTAAETPAPRPDGACAFHCYVAQGHDKVNIAAEDENRFREAFGATMDQFRQCSYASGRWRRKSSPVLNLRFNFQGELADEGHDLTGYGNDPQYNCFATVPHTLPKVAGPPATTVRCAETCETPKTQKAQANPRGNRGPKAPPPPAPAPAPAPAPKQ